MKRITSRKEEMELVRSKIQELIKIVSELETEFPGRHFTIDGNLVGSIGEVMAAYYYGIDLYEASTERHDGAVDGRQVQIKITQRDNIMISAEPDYLIVLYMNKEYILLFFESFYHLNLIHLFFSLLTSLEIFFSISFIENIRRWCYYSLIIVSIDIPHFF